jgi:alkylation response protein AidB-like acyl-CoA dehydrogenase
MGTLTADELDELRASARNLFARESPASLVRALATSELGFDRELWARTVELGWAGLLVPTEHGGQGAGMVEVAVVAEELGRRVTPSPFLASAVLATTALVRGGSPEQQDRWLPALASGELLGTAALTGTRGYLAPDLLDAELETTAQGVRLTGAAGFVPDAHVADLMLVAARDRGHRRLAIVERGSSVRIEVAPTVDHTRRLATVKFDGTVLARDAILARDVTESVVAYGVTTVAADALGAAREMLDRSVEYAKQRIQFGRPIGSFQAVKHKLADMFVGTEASAVAVEGAAAALDADPTHAERAVGAAATHARDACVRVAGDAVQVHGGIGFTWEHECHLYLKRVKLDQALFGDPTAHREHLARVLLTSATVPAT